MTKVVTVLGAVALALLITTGAFAVPIKSVGGPIPALPKGVPGTVAVVATGSFDKDAKIVPVVLRNNTKHPVDAIKITSTATAHGHLVATGSDQGVQPGTLVPGGRAIAYVYYDGATPPNGSSFKFSVTSKTAPSNFFDVVDLSIKTANYTGGKLIGVAHNGTHTKVRGPLGVYATCVIGGRIVRMAYGFSGADDAPAGSDAPFTLDLTSFDLTTGATSTPKCDRILVAMSGYLS